MTNLEMLKKSILKVEEEGSTYNILDNVRMDKTGVILTHNSEAYRVDVIDDEVVSCSCPHHTYRKAICKHMIKVSEEYNLDIKGLNVVEDEKDNENVIELKESII